MFRISKCSIFLFHYVYLFRQNSFFCRHYSYAIEMYRAEKLAQYHSAQAARGMAMGAPLGLGLPPVHMVNQAMMYPTMAPASGYGQPVNLQMGQVPVQGHVQQMPMMVGQPQQPLQQGVYGAPVGMNMNNGMGMPPQQPQAMGYGYAPQQTMGAPQGHLQQQQPPQQQLQGYGAPY